MSYNQTKSVKFKMVAFKQDLSLYRLIYEMEYRTIQLIREIKYFLKNRSYYRICDPFLFTKCIEFNDVLSDALSLTYVRLGAVLIQFQWTTTQFVLLASVI